MKIYLVFGSHGTPNAPIYITALVTSEKQAQIAIKEILFFGREWNDLHADSRKNLRTIHEVEQGEVPNIDEAGIYSVEIDTSKEWMEGHRAGAEGAVEASDRERAYRGWVC